MKKIVLVVLMVIMVSLPCLAQEIEPEGLFSINGTIWNMCYLGLFLPPISLERDCDFLLFYQGKMYRCDDASGTYCRIKDNSFYIDLGVVSIVWGGVYPFGYELMILQPIGLGIYTSGGLGCGYYCNFFYTIGIMYKVNDNWKPPETE